MEKRADTNPTRSIDWCIHFYINFFLLKKNSKKISCHQTALAEFFLKSANFIFKSNF